MLGLKAQVEKLTLDRKGDISSIVTRGKEARMINIGEFGDLVLEN